MAIKRHISHIKSNVVINGKPKLVDPQDILFGEIAINYATDYETISLKNTSGDIVTFSSDAIRDSAMNEALLGKTDVSAFTAHTSDSTIHHTHSNKSVLDSITSEKIAQIDKIPVSAEYDSTAEKIYFRDENSAILSSMTINAQDFIVDGMIDTVELQTKSGTTYLVITWNTDAGKETTELNIGNIFNADNYYDKTDTNALLANKLDTSAFTQASETIAAALTDLDERIDNIDVDYLINVTYSELVTLRNNGELKAGKQYRITDYITTVDSSDTMGASALTHQFDIIVTADDDSTLNENARAILHDGDSYFSGCNLSAWSLKYSLDNDEDRFEWADTTNGKGVIYYMKDEWDNECPYDFKNVTFVRYEITASTKASEMNGLYAFGSNSFHGVSVSDTPLNVLTFTIYNNSQDVIYDNSLYGACTSNTIKPWINVNTGKMFLPNNVFMHTDTHLVSGNYIGINSVNNTFNGHAFSNYLGCDSADNIFGITSQYNKLGGMCQSNIFSNDAKHNKIGNNNKYNMFRKSCYYNELDVACQNNTLGEGCIYNKLGCECTYNTLGEDCSKNTIGMRSGLNTFSDLCKNNIIGNMSSSNSFGDYCSNNIIGNESGHNTFSGSNEAIVFVNYCNYISLAEYSKCITFGNKCDHITFSKLYTQDIIVEGGNKYIELTSTQTTSASNILRNITIAQAVNNSTTLKTISHNTVNDTSKTIYQPINSTIVSV